MYKRFFGVLGLSALVLAGCNEDPMNPESFPCDSFLLGYDPATGDTLTTAFGNMDYIEVKEGTGAVNATSSNWATVNFSGYLLDPEGEAFQSSCDPGSTVIAYHIGTGQYASGGLVIEGFSYGVVGMKVGGVRRVIIPMELAFGPADETNTHELAGKDLIFDIQLVRLQ